MRAVVIALVALSGCSGCSENGQPDGGDGNDHPYNECAGDPQSFVRQVFLTATGRRAKSQAEVDVYVDLYNAAAARGDDPRDLVARAIMNRPEFTERWVDVVMDAMHVQRVDVQTEASCWDQGARTAVTAALAAAIRDNPATGSADGHAFTMLDVARSAIALDDLSPLYRAQMFSLVSHPIPAANVPAVQAELARRADFGETFDAAFLHRDIVCLGCHNSEHSVTDSDDPMLDRFWPAPGLPERAVYGDSSGIAIERAHGAFRVDSFVDGGTKRPWSWDAACGQFAEPASIGDDIAGVDAKLASVTGKRATVFALEASLARGFAALRGGGPPIGNDGAIADPDAALAWLVTLKVTEDVWRQATGTGLTIANYFPRNQASGELLTALATKFAQSGYSLKALVAAIVATDFYNRQPPELACGAEPYTYPNVFDPWVIADVDPAKRKNSPGDAVTAVDPRTLVGALAAALEWPPPPAATRFPDYGEPGCEDSSCSQLGQFCGIGQCCTTYHAVCQMMGLSPQVELPFERGVGMFLRNSERGFRGLDFQARLVWENRNGACTRPRWATNDFIDKLAAAAAADPSATAADLVAALKDRLIGEPAIADGAEHDALAAIVGPLEAPATGVAVDALRRVCGALTESPQFLLQGIAGRGGDRPKLTPVDQGYDAVCADLASRGIGVPGRAVSCNGTVVLDAAREAPPAPADVGPIRAVPVRRGLPSRRR